MRTTPSSLKMITGFVAALALTLGLAAGVAGETSAAAGGRAPHTVVLADNKGPTSVTP
ncbi:hypothetical protein ACGFW5_09290 [Streptomyces sp. NPDC048416]|uniref:hypothetical protein n=1 Tax=Streptomyces sp. NPDC048416 TaxID=3365546 RepID=UPI0037209C78